MWEKTPFKTYDCLMPLTMNYQYARGLLCQKCKEKRGSYLIWDPPMSMDLLAAATSYWRGKATNEKVEELTAKVNQANEEMKIVRWYIDVFEDGKDTRDILNMYADLKVEHKKL